MIRLLLKTYSNHKKYLCKRESDDYMTYLGSGDNITSDLVLIDTEVLLETEDKKLFKEVGTYYSKLWNIVDNPLFLNKKYEEGDGGDTVSRKFWITNGKKDRYIDKGSEIPEGWRKGRSTGAFTDSKKQKELSSRANHNTEKQKAASRKMGLANKGHKNSVGGKNTQAKSIRTPFGDFEYIQKAVETLGKSRPFIMRRIHSDDFPDWCFK